jgi:cation:H+ antiporter
MLLSAAPIAAENPLSILWTAPAILIASVMIAWGAEASQFFMAQGFALVILAWMQCLPEFAVEAVLAWHQQNHLLIANLTGAIRLLTGLGWPMIYATAAFAYRRKFQKPMREIEVDRVQSVQIVAVLVCLAYITVLCIKNSLTVLDGALLLAIYACYLLLLRKLPAEDHEDIEDLGRIPKAVVKAPRSTRIVSILILFGLGGAIIFIAADPFVGSLFAISTTLGVSQFVFIQWIAPFISEFPEQVSAFYWARGIDRAGLALMNMVSSNITQWTLLAATLPIVLSFSHGAITPILFDPQQSREMWMTLGQSLLGLLFLLEMRFLWWEAAGLFALFALSLVILQFHVWFTYTYFAWSAIELVRLASHRRWPKAFTDFASIWQDHVKKEIAS